MDRRQFIKAGVGAGLFSGIYVFTGKKSFSYAADSPYDLVAVKGSSPSKMFDEAIKSIGGMKKYVKKNQTVVVKPNIGWDVTPERAANTNPELVKRIIEHCKNAGAKKVYVFDNTCDNWKKCYSNSGIEKAVKDSGGTIVTGNSERYYHEVEINKGDKLKDAKVHELILESDVFLNVPILKSHGSAQLTVSMKNFMGIIWDRRYWHRNDLHQCIADFSTYCKPTLNIVDAYRVMKKNGPRGVSEDDVVRLDSLLISNDIVAADSASAKLFGYEPDDISYIKIADKMGIGKKDLSKLNIKRIKL